MRKLLALLLVCLFAGIVVLVLSQRTRQSGLAPAAPVSDPGAPAEDAVLSTEPALQPVRSATHEDLAAADSPSATPSATSATRLILHVRNQRTHEPLSGVRVKALARASPSTEVWQGADTRAPHGDLRVHPQTGADGTADLAVPPGIELRVWVAGERGACSETSLDILPLAEGEAREIDVELLPPNDAQLVGRVVDYLTRAPIAGAIVRLVRSNMSSTNTGETGWHNDVLGSVRSRGDGSFEFTFTSWVLPHLQIDAEGYSRALFEVSTHHADAAHVLEVELLKECRLIVHVIDTSGNAVSGVDVSVDSQGWESADEVERAAGEPRAMISDQHWSERTKADGRATIAGLPPSMELRVKGVRDFLTVWTEPEPLELEVGETRELEWRIGAGTRLSGIVLDGQDRPVPLQELWIAKRYTDTTRYFSAYERSSARFRASSDAAGRFAFEDIPAGHWSIGPAAGQEWSSRPIESALAPLAVALDLAGEPTRELTLHVERGLFVRGTVLAPDGATLHGAFVQYEGGDGLGVPATAEGAFVCGPLAAGECTLVATCMGQYADSEPVRAAAGDTGVKLRLRLGGGLRGIVIDAASGLPCEANLIVSPELESLGPNGHQEGTSVGPDGTFVQPGLAPGRYDIAALSEDGRCAVQAGIEIRAGSEATGIVLALKPGGSIRFAYHGTKDLMNVTATSSGVPLGFPLWIRPNVRSGLWAPAGTVVLEIRKEYKGPARTQEVELKVGETREIVLTDED